MSTDKLGHPPPIVQSMILADHIHRDSMTGKKFILGTYNQVVSPKFPFVKSGLCVYLAITEAHGRTMLRMRIIEVDDAESPIYESVHPIEMPNPTEVFETVFNASVVFPAPGHYRVQLLVGNEVLRELRLRVSYRPQNVERSREPE